MQLNYPNRSVSPLSRQHTQASPEQVNWDVLEDYVGSSDEETRLQHSPERHAPHRFREHPQEHSQDTYNQAQGQLQEQSQETIESRERQWPGLQHIGSTTEPSDEDAQWHVFMGETYNDQRDEVICIVLLVLVAVVCLTGAIMIGIMVT